MALAIVSFSSCEEDGPEAVTSLSQLNGVWKATSVDGAEPSEYDYLAVVNGAYWGMLREGSLWSNSVSTTLAGDGSGEVYMTNCPTIYINKFTGNSLEIEYKGEVRKYQLDKKASTAIIKNVSYATYSFLVYEKDATGEIIYVIDLGDVVSRAFRGPVCLYTDTLYAAVYDNFGNFVETVQWSGLTSGMNWTLEYE